MSRPPRRARASPNCSAERRRQQRPVSDRQPDRFRFARGERIRTGSAESVESRFQTRLICVEEIGADRFGSVCRGDLPFAHALHRKGGVAVRPVESGCDPEIAQSNQAAALSASPPLTAAIVSRSTPRASTSTRSARGRAASAAGRWRATASPAAASPAQGLAAAVRIGGQCMAQRRSAEVGRRGNRLRRGSGVPRKERGLRVEQLGANRLRREPGSCAAALPPRQLVRFPTRGPTQYQSTAISSTQPQATSHDLDAPSITIGGCGRRRDYASWIGTASSAAAWAICPAMPVARLCSSLPN